MKEFLNRGPALPNSLSMHLLIETADHKVVGTVISKYKDNDYSNTYAFTIGEQLEVDDIHTSGNEYNDDFMVRWLQRALREKFGINEANFTILFEPDSFRVLSLDYEGDIYNFAILCVLRTSCSFDKFKQKIVTFTDAQETKKIEAFDIDDIPELLVNKKLHEDITCLKGEEYIFHPSSFLRLLVFYLHKMGKAKGSNMIMECYRKL